MSEIVGGCNDRRTGFLRSGSQAQTGRTVPSVYVLSHQDLRVESNLKQMHTRLVPPCFKKKFIDRFIYQDCYLLAQFEFIHS